MTHCYIKCLIALSVGIMALFYAAHNLVNWTAAEDFVAYVLSLQGHALYPKSLVPAIDSPLLIGGVLALICLGEAAAGVLSLMGCAAMWHSRHAGKRAFAAAKRYAILGAGLATGVWFLLFSAIGGAVLQMWQTESGASALAAAFQYAGLSFLSLIYLSMPDSAEPV